MNPFSHTEYSISDSLKTVRKSVLIYEIIILKWISRKYTFSKSDYVTVLTGLIRPYIIYQKAWFDKTIEMKFEDGMFLVPSEYDKLLREEYGGLSGASSRRRKKTHTFF